MKKLLGVLAVGTAAAAVVAYAMKKNQKNDAKEIVEEAAEILHEEAEKATALVKEVIEEGLHDEEEERLNTLCEEGFQALSNEDDNRKERPLQHTITFENQEDLEKFKEAVILDGYVVTSGTKELELLVLNISKVDLEVIKNSVFHLAKISHEHHGTYDHWVMK